MGACQKLITLVCSAYLIKWMQQRKSVTKLHHLLHQGVKTATSPFSLWKSMWSEVIIMFALSADDDKIKQINFLDFQ